ncbi:MAG: LysR family transcriptional regulator [Phycisphaeraceae bacterium]|nr:LysR family transcriptional regulator [Phycisphaeraceae bacterium]
MQTIKLFCDVARLRSISRAAVAHGITQSAVSQRISQLEKRLGVTLLDRSVRPLALTDAGRAYHGGCLDLLERYQRLERQVSALSRLEGSVRVEAIYSAGIDLISQVRRDFLQEHPRAVVEVEYKRPEAVHESVRQGRCDLGIVSYPGRWRDVSAIPLRDERMAVVCHPNHPLARYRRVEASALASWPMVTFETDLPAGRHIDRYLRENGVTPVVDNVFDNMDTIKGAVAVTDRFAILPERNVQREAAAGTLAVIELLPKLCRPLGIIHPRRQGGGKGFTTTAQAFIDRLLENAGGDVEPEAATDAASAQLVEEKL